MIPRRRTLLYITLILLGFSCTAVAHTLAERPAPSPEPVAAGPVTIPAVF